jgi:hypothetical protein
VVCPSGQCAAIDHALKRAATLGKVFRASRKSAAPVWLNKRFDFPNGLISKKNKNGMPDANHLTVA